MIERSRGEDEGVRAGGGGREERSGKGGGLEEWRDVSPSGSTRTGGGDSDASSFDEKMADGLGFA